MQAVDKVKFNGVEYPIYELDTQNEEIGTILIGTDLLDEVLDDALASKDPNVWKPAQEIDNELYCFMPAEYLEDNDEEWIRNYFNEYYD